MRTIIVTTDFSKSALNALDYACAFANAYGFKILLTHIYSIPTTYAGEAFGMASLKDEMEGCARDLVEEARSARTTHPELEIDTNISAGGFLETLRGLEKELHPAMIIMGAAGEYSEFSLWEDDWLATLVSVSTPVLVVPPGVSFKAIKEVAFATDYKKAPLAHQVNVVKRLTQLSGAKLHVVHVATQPSAPIGHQHANELQKEFGEINPEYHTLESRHIIKAISEFTEQNKIDLLFVVPHKHDFWYKLFNKSYTKQLARLNHLPVVALHE